jgi:hypothetical protein
MPKDLYYYRNQKKERYSTMSTIIILAVVSSIVATILAFVYIVPEKKRAGLNQFGKFLHDTVNFKYLIVEKILQALYIFATANVILTGFFMLFYVEPGYDGYYYSSPDTWYGGYGLLTMIVGPIALRLVYEFLMMTILLIKNVIQINNKMKVDEDKKADIFSAGVMENAEKSENAFCKNCGANVDGKNFCTNCGTQVK